ncbi:MAG: hypothetical protein CV087_17445 [Candidatus Brocadia sp. WS118]|nr:MAG: hypothetical protein CV087_17445 [Candidatus Brocadia sp. WS118]
MPVNIHGKEYITVAERVKQAHEDKAVKLIQIASRVIKDEPVVMEATVILERDGIRQTFTGISAANDSKAIEKQSPYEVAETSAVGRALGFAGFGAVDGIASADEMVKAGEQPDPIDDAINSTTDLGNCKDCGEPNTRYKTGRVGCSKFCWKK